MKGKVWNISELEALEEAAKEVLNELQASVSTVSTVLALSGDLGAGKTTFTQILAKLLGVGESVTSPTFVIMKKYPLNTNTHFRNLIHVDAYRLESAEELKVLGFTSELSDPGNLVVVEWAEKVSAILPPTAVNLQFTLDGTRRTLKAS